MSFEPKNGDLLSIIVHLYRMIAIQWDEDKTRITSTLFMKPVNDISDANAVNRGRLL